MIEITNPKLFLNHRHRKPCRQPRAAYGCGIRLTSASGQTRTSTLGCHLGVSRTGGRPHRLGKGDSEQARAEEAKTGNGYSEETVSSEFFTGHGTPPTARQMLIATCNRLFQISSETRAIEMGDSIVRRYASDTERDRQSNTEVCDVCPSRPIILDVSGLSILTRAHLDRRTPSQGTGDGSFWKDSSPSWGKNWSDGRLVWMTAI